MKEKLIGVLEGVIIAILGVIIAVSGGGEALDTYIAIISLIGGACLLALSIFSLVKSKILPFGTTFLGVALLTVGISLFTPYLSFGILINLFVLLVLAFGIALILYGLYALLAKKALFTGIGQLVIGVVVLVLAILFMTVDDFRTAFWIIIGIVVAVYGVLVIISSLIAPNKAKK